MRLRNANAGALYEADIIYSMDISKQPVDRPPAVARVIALMAHSQKEGDSLEIDSGSRDWLLASDVSACLI